MTKELKIATAKGSIGIVVVAVCPAALSQKSARQTGNSEA